MRREVLPRVDHLVAAELGAAEGLLVDDQVRLRVGLAGDQDARARVVGVLGDETLAEPVDEDALHQVLGRIERGGDQRAVHVQRLAARRETELDAGAVVVRRVLAS